jgi:hypothetical protein
MVVKMRKDDEDKVVRDGQVLRVSLLMMDGVQREIADQRVGLVDAAGQSWTVGHRPGAVYLTGRQREVSSAAKAAARDEYVLRLTDGWRTDHLIAPGAERRETPSATTVDAREEAYATYERHLSNAWRAR